MNRRGFLASLAAAVLADPERLLWRPRAKTISIPKPAPEFSHFVLEKPWDQPPRDGTIYIALFKSYEGPNGLILDRFVEVPTPSPRVTFEAPESWGVIDQACVVDAEGRFYPIDLRVHPTEALLLANRIDREISDLYAGLR